MSAQATSTQYDEVEAKQKSFLDSHNRYLTFYLDDELYGVEIVYIKEIIAYMKTTRIPKAPNYLKGVMNLRGNIIPVVDTRTKFNLAVREPDMLTAIVIMEVQGANIGFIVDCVEEVVSIPQENIVSTPDFGTKIDTEFIKCMGQVDNEVVMVLHLDMIFNQQELEIMEHVEK